MHLIHIFLFFFFFFLMNHAISFLYKYIGVIQTLPQKAELLQIATALPGAKAYYESHGICHERVI